MLDFAAIPESVRIALKTLVPLPSMRSFALGGGTALALRYGHRLSVDLDFFTQEEFSVGDLFENLNLQKTMIIAQATNSLTLDFAGVKIDLLRHAYPLLAAVEVIDGIPIISIQDLAAMKLNAIANRGSKKDFFDIVELLDHFPIQQLLGFFTQKYQSSDAFTVIRSMAWFQDAEQEPDPVSLREINWTNVKSKVHQELAAL
jgi:predicted nucleotidyltransferase component of viral defense system